MKKSKYVVKAPLEPYTRKLIEDKLSLLKYNMDEMDLNCNVYRERAKMEYQDSLLQGKNPDFIIYKTGTDIPLAVIEAKRLGVTLEQAVNQAIDFYAKPLNIPIVFVFNGASFYACSQNKEPIKIDKIEIKNQNGNVGFPHRTKIIVTKIIIGNDNKIRLLIAKAHLWQPSIGVPSVLIFKSRFTIREHRTTVNIISQLL